MREIFLFGTGLDAEIILSNREDVVEYYQDEILGCINNNSLSWGEYIWGHKIYGPEQLKENYDYVVIATRDFFVDIYNQCINELGIKKDKILSMNQYLRMINIEYQYNKNQAKVSVKEKEKINNKRIAVYTAITDNYDNLKEPRVLGDNTDYICFTNNPGLKSDNWKIKLMEDDIVDSAYKIRRYKILPHLYLNEYDISIWVDGSFEIKEDFVSYIEKFSNGANLLFFPHPDRKCIYDEMAALIEYRKETKSNLIKQSYDYLMKGYPENNGLVEGGCIVRNHNDESVISTMELWWNELYKYGKRDQIALAYSLWKTGISFDLCNLNINDNRWIVRKRHTPGNNVKC